MVVVVVVAGCGGGGKKAGEGKGEREMRNRREKRAPAHPPCSFLSKITAEKKNRQPRLSLYLHARGLLARLHGPHHERHHGQRLLVLRPPRG